MENTDVVMFCQSDFLCASFIAFQDMKRRGHLCDVTITTRNQSFTAHRVILEAGIPYFTSVFTDSGTETVEAVALPDNLEPKALESLIDFAYSGKVNISTENANALLQASDYLKLDQLRDACVEFLSSRLRVNNISEVSALAHSLNNSKLIESSNGFVRENFEKLSKSGDFASLPYSCVKAVISEDDLEVSSEEIVFEAVIRWVKNSPAQRHAKLPELLTEIRMTHLPADYVANRVSSEELIRASVHCREYVDQVKNYLLSRNKSAFRNLKTQPRKRSNVEDVIYAFCIDDEGSKYTVCYCDFVSETWRNVTSKLVQNDMMFSATVVNEKIYTFFEETIQTFDPKTLEWEVLEPKHKKLFHASISPCGNMIYFFGSFYAECANKIRCFDTVKSKWLPETTMRTPRWSSASASVGESVYVSGGLSPDLLDRKNFSSVEKYNTSTGQCYEVSPMLTTRSNHGCVSMKEKIYVCGGFSDHSRMTCIAEVYDSLTDQWNFISPKLSGRWGLAYVCHKSKIYELGGGDIRPEVVITMTTEIYDPECDKWELGFDAPHRLLHAVSIPTIRS